MVIVCANYLHRLIKINIQLVCEVMLMIGSYNFINSPSHFRYEIQIVLRSLIESNVALITF